ncbi:MAG: phosphoribosylanthranilate isomerase [Burkholderiales bacterium]
MDTRSVVLQPRVKICGIRRPEDAQLAVELGAHALGFVFWPNSPRAVTAEQARIVIDRVPPFVAAVGVFVNQAPADVLDTARRAGLTAIQLHGDEEASAYAGCGWRVIKALPVGKDFTLSAVEDVPAEMTVLLDAHDPVRRGGTGRAIEWSVAATAARVRPIVLSGGLTPANVRTAIDAVQPFAVDVSSGVESAPGVKDETKMRAFFAALRS